MYVKLDLQLWPNPTPGSHGFKFTLPEDDSQQVTAFLVNWFLRRRFLKFFKKFLIIHLEKSVVHYFSQLRIIFACGCFEPRLVEICAVVLEKMLKSLRTNGRPWDGRQNKYDQKSFRSGELKLS